MDKKKTVEDLTENVDDGKLIIKTDGEGWVAVASSGFNGDDAIVPTEVDTKTPFPFKVVGDISTERAAEELRKQFDAQIDKVYNAVADSDDPLETILDMEPDSLVGE